MAIDILFASSAVDEQRISEVTQGVAKIYSLAMLRLVRESRAHIGRAMSVAGKQKARKQKTAMTALAMLAENAMIADELNPPHP